MLDDGPTAGGETARTTAHLVFYNDDGMSKIEKLHGTDGLRIATESHRAAVDKIEAIAREEQIDCDFYRVDGYLFITPGGQGIDFLQKELDAAHRVGSTESHWVDRAPLPAFDTGQCLCYPNHGQFHPLKYFAGLAKAIQRERRGDLQQHARRRRSRAASPRRSRPAQGRVVTARDAVVVATNTPVNDLRRDPHEAARRTARTCSASRCRRARSRARSTGTRIDPYHYVRLQELDDDRAHEVLISGGEDHKTGQANDPAAPLRRRSRSGRASGSPRRRRSSSTGPGR